MPIGWSLARWLNVSLHEIGVAVRTCSGVVLPGGHGRVVQQLERYLRDLRTQGSPWPDLIVVATDANCQGFRDRVRTVDPQNPPAPVVLAVPDPHVERWLLLDGAAFKAVFGQGCEAPDRKCSRNRYKDLLIAAIRAAGRTTTSAESSTPRTSSIAWTSTEPPGQTLRCAALSTI